MDNQSEDRIVNRNTMLQLALLIQAESAQLEEYGRRLAINNKRLRRLLVEMERAGVLLAEDDAGNLSYVAGIERLHQSDDFA